MPNSAKHREISQRHDSQKANHLSRAAYVLRLAAFATKNTQLKTCIIRGNFKWLQANIMYLFGLYSTLLPPSTAAISADASDNNNSPIAAPVGFSATCHNKNTLVKRKKKRKKPIRPFVRQKYHQQERSPHCLRLDDTRVCYFYCELYSIPEGKAKCAYRTLVHHEHRGTSRRRNQVLDWTIFRELLHQGYQQGNEEAEHLIAI
jgi:hypothetical protein